MELFEKVARLAFMVLFGTMFSGVFILLALEGSIRRWREERRVRLEAPASELEAAYRARPKMRRTIIRAATAEW